MNLAIFIELERILKSKDITVTVDKNSSSHEFYIVEDFHGKEIIRYTHSNVDKNIYDMRVLGEQLVHWENPAKNTPEMCRLMEIVDLIKLRDQEQTALLHMTEREKVLLKNLRYINARTK